MDCISITIVSRVYDNNNCSLLVKLHSENAASQYSTTTRNNEYGAFTEHQQIVYLRGQTDVSCQNATLESLETA